MNKSKYQIVLLIPLIYIFSCNKLFEDDETIIFKNAQRSDFENIKLIQYDYDSLEISNDENLLVEKQSVELIVFGDRENGVFTPADTTFPTYTKLNDGRYLLDFSMEIELSTESYMDELSWKIINYDGTWFYVDTLWFSYKYPYQEAEVLVDLKSLGGWVGYRHIQDFAIIPGGYLMHPTGPHGLLKYELSTNELTQLTVYPGGDFITADSTHAFLDINISWIVKYNYIENVYEMEFDTSQLDFTTYTTMGIWGMCLYNNELYAVLKDINGPMKLSRFTKDGIYLGSQVFIGWYIEINNDILYSTGYSYIESYNLQTLELVSVKKSPVYVLGGIRIKNDYLYYYDYRKNFLGVIHLSALQEL